ncbi:MAG: ribosomal-processing cysteine protease Prp [Clostridia bacterium]|nr:ribosomal-processing cysteine protease Prp [Clostridia bacterium]
MTTVKVFKTNGRFCGFSVADHSGYDEEGEDIVCSAVSSAVQFAANGITEVAGAEADVSVNEKTAEITLRTSPDNDGAQILLAAFALHMEILSEDYNENIKFCILEV